MTVLDIKKQFLWQRTGQGSVIHYKTANPQLVYFQIVQHSPNADFEDSLGSEN